MNQFTEAARKLREAADALDAFIEPFTARGLPTPGPKFKVGDRVRWTNPTDARFASCGRIAQLGFTHADVVVDGEQDATTRPLCELVHECPQSTPEPVEPQAGQVWVNAENSPLVLSCFCNLWTTTALDGRYNAKWRYPFADEAVKSLTYAAPSVAEYYQAALRAENARLAKRVADLELNAAPPRSQIYNSAAMIVNCEANNLPSTLITPEAQVFREEVRAIIQPALAKAREEGAQAAREERFVALRWFDLAKGWGVYDQEARKWVVGAADRGMCETEARAEAARRNAADKERRHADKG